MKNMFKMVFFLNGFLFCFCIWLIQKIVDDLWVNELREKGGGVLNSKNNL